MRRLIIIGIVIVVLILGAGSCFNCMKSSGFTGSPEATVKSAIMAMESMKPAKVTQYFTPIPGSMMSVRLSNTFSRISKLDIQNLNVMIVANEGAAAKVQATYDMVMTSELGVVGTEHCRKTLKLVQIEKEWYVNEPF